MVRINELMVRREPYQSTWLNRKITVSPVVVSVNAVEAVTIGIFVRG